MRTRPDENTLTEACRRLREHLEARAQTGCGPAVMGDVGREVSERS